MSRSPRALLQLDLSDMLLASPHERLKALFRQLSSSAESIITAEMGQTKRRVAIIGGGPAGLACLRVFSESKHPWELTLFEGRDEIGGVWYRGDDERNLPGGQPPASPVYDSLTTNLPHCVMAFNKYSFPPSTLLFPPAATVHQYLLDYVEDFNLRPYIHLNRRVEEATWSGSEWRIQVSNQEAPHIADHLIVANGHYCKPHEPDFVGLKEWESVEGHSISHSTWYREPSSYAGKRVLVIGGGPSGTDISAEVATVATATYHSVRNFEKDDTSTPKKRPAVASFSKNGTVIYVDGSKDVVDRVILATGYEFNFPFLPQMKTGLPPKDDPFPPDLYNSLSHVYPLTRHLFPIEDDFPIGSIAFIGLLSRVVPFPLVEAQAALSAEVFANPSLLNVNTERVDILARYQLLKEGAHGDQRAIAKEWHRLPDQLQFQYRKELLNLAGVTKWVAEDWIVEAYLASKVIREQWKELVRKGEAARWVEGVSTDEGWRNVIRRLKRRAEGHTEDDGETHLI